MKHLVDTLSRCLDHTELALVGLLFFAIFGSCVIEATTV